MELTNKPSEVSNAITEGGQSRVNGRSSEIRDFILSNVGEHPNEIAGLSAAHFKITRQAVSRHLKKLVDEKALTPEGHTRSRSYRLTPLSDWIRAYQIVPGLAEDQAWSRDVAPVLGKLPQNVLDIWHFGFTEMFNNAIDHSGGSEIGVRIIKTAADTQIQLRDNGIGIFRKIRAALNLLDERHAVLELAKGKLTTEPERHTGQGIFFTSRLVDHFNILSGGVFFSHAFENEEDWIFEEPRAPSAQGTLILMKLNNHSSRTDKSVFDQFSSGDDYGFTKTVVPVKLAQYGEDKLISRSQAKRLLSRVDLFRVVLFDFEGVDTIGQAFADEIFRIFARDHSQIEVMSINASPEVQRMIAAARAQWASEIGGV
jgi:DNA-binding transcriptional ArsR family regulator